MKKQQIKLSRKLQLTKETLLALESQRQIAGGIMMKDQRNSLGSFTQLETCVTFPPCSPRCVHCK